MSIGELARATGIPAGTLRTWERRYGFPSPERRASGHRRYRPGAVSRLRAVRRALDAGHRASTVLPMPEDRLAALLAAAEPTRPSAVNTSDLGDAGDEVNAWLELTTRLDADGLGRRLRRAWQRTDSSTFIYDLTLPFLRQVGSCWERAELDVAHEHLASEQIRGLLAEKWRNLSGVARGGTVLLATLPGERHCLALHLAAVLLALANRRVLFLGAETPLAELAAAARQAGVEAVVVGSSTAASADEVRAGLRALRSLLAAPIELVSGGTRAPLELEAVTWLPDLRDLATWAAR